MMAAPRSASSMPASGPVIMVVSSITLTPSSGAGMALTSWVEVLRRGAVVLDGILGGFRQGEADGTRLLLHQVRHQAGAARHDRYALHAGERKAGIEQHRRNGARRVEHQALAGLLPNDALGGARRLHVRPAQPDFVGDRQQARDARIGGAMERMAITRERHASGAIFVDQRTGRRGNIAAGGALDDAGEKFSGVLGA